MQKNCSIIKIKGILKIKGIKYENVNRNAGWNSDNDGLLTTGGKDHSHQRDS